MGLPPTKRRLPTTSRRTLVLVSIYLHTAKSVENNTIDAVLRHTPAKLRHHTRKIVIPDECRAPFASVAQSQRRYFAGDEGVYKSARFAFDTHFSPWLEKIDTTRPYRILDLGCGFATYDSLVLEALPNTIEILLVDKTNTRVNESKRIGDWGKADTFQFYNDLECAGKIVSSNTENRVARIRTVGADGDLTPEKIGGPVDIFYSILSWCFHYPAEVYAKAASDVVNLGGLLIITSRRGTEQASSTELARYGFEEIYRFQSPTSSRWTEIMFRKSRARHSQARTRKFWSWAAAPAVAVLLLLAVCAVLPPSPRQKR